MGYKVLIFISINNGDPNMAIVKKIHYCWFGRGPIPVKEINCIETWKKFFPDYEFILWNEDNFDYRTCAFARQAYENKKYAFVSDYARAKVLYEYGGIYLDTDVKVIKSFRDLLDQSEGIVGFERKAFIGTAVIACRLHDPCIKELLDYYERHDFIQENGNFDNIANVSILTDILKGKGLILGGERQKVAGFEVYNREIFYPKKLSESKFNVTDVTVSVHMCSNSWLTDRERKRGNNRIWIEIMRPILRGCRKIGIKIIGKEKIRSVEIKVRNILR